MTAPDWIRRFERLAQRYGGFAYPWRSDVEAGNGEDAYSALVREHLRPELAVIEAGCGSGTDALLFGPHVRTYVGYDAVAGFVTIARRRATYARLTAVSFVVADSSPARGGRVPADDGCVDLIISRRGPTSFILDARRVCRPGGVLLQVCYLPPPLPAWNDALPAHLRAQPEPDTGHDQVLAYLERAGLPLHSSSAHEVNEHFADPAQLLLRLAWDRALDDPRPGDLDAVTAVFRSVAVAGRVTLRHRRFLWKALVP